MSTAKIAIRQNSLKPTLISFRASCFLKKPFICSHSTFIINLYLVMAPIITKLYLARLPHLQYLTHIT